MNRLWIGLGILALLLVPGWWSVEWMERCQSQTAALLEQGASEVAQENWSAADDLLTDAERQWQRHWKFTASLADHTTLDEIDAEFAQLEIYRARRETTLCAAGCVHLAQQIRALEEAYRLTWWNLL